MKTLLLRIDYDPDRVQAALSTALDDLLPRPVDDMLFDYIVSHLDYDSVPAEIIDVTDQVLPLLNAQPSPSPQRSET